jgi:hypothetical protein
VEIGKAIAEAGDVVGYWINRRFMFMGRWLQHAYYPNWNLRLFRHALGRYEKLTDVPTDSGDNEVHEHVLINGSTAKLQVEIDHYAFPSIDVFVENITAIRIGKRAWQRMRAFARDQNESAASRSIDGAN